jgi:hypothetical protein
VEGAVASSRPERAEHRPDEIILRLTLIGAVRLRKRPGDVEEAAAQVFDVHRKVGVGALDCVAQVIGREQAAGDEVSGIGQIVPPQPA